jgi:hypothetical protein
VAANSKGTAKPRGRPFQPGQSGNPSGRPAVAREFRELCRDFMSEQGWHNLRAMANDPDSPHYFRANELIAAYALGKPTQGLEVSGAGGGPIMLAHLTDEAIDEEIRRLLPG